MDMFDRIGTADELIATDQLPVIACYRNELSDRQRHEADDMADAYNDCTAVAVQQTVDRTPRGAFNRPI
jgi:hypothetical protein